ncbi:MAG TPA: hypothetical protein VJ992_09550 [Gemmatimonadales bacterium]|nr:hypothetical protein [Gemmatimonadales bacterium]
MPAPASASADRRAFLRNLMGGAAAAALGVSADVSALPARPRTAPTRVAREPWDDSWVGRITGWHKQVFDAPEVAEGTVLHQARVFMQGYTDVYGTSDADTTAVLVIRHKAIPIALDDAMWEHYELGKKVKVKDPATGKDAKCNPFLNANDPGTDKNSLIWSDGGLDTLVKRGAVVLVCNLALNAFASAVIQKKDKVDHAEAMTRAKAGLLPGTVLVPSGIFGVARAEEAGCHYMRAT